MNGIMSDADYQAALEQQARAQNERSVMEAQWQAAQELRGAQHAPQAQNTVQALGSGGIGAGLGALATEMRRARGFNESKRLEKAMMEQGGSRQAGDIAGKILEKAIARDEREYNRGQDDIDNAFRNRQQNFRESQGKQAAEKWVNAEGKSITVQYDSRGRPIKPGGGRYTQAELEGYYPEDIGSGYQSDKALNSKEIRDISEGASRVRVMRDLYDSYSDSYAQPFEVAGKPLPSRFLNKPIATLAQEDLLEYADEAQDQHVKEALRWFAAWKREFEMLDRNEMFGSALTDNEKRLYDEAAGIHMGMDKQEIRRRIAAITRVRDEKFRKYLNLQRTRGKSQRATTDEAARGLYEAGPEGRYQPTMSLDERYGVDPAFAPKYELVPGAAGAPNAMKRYLETLPPDQQKAFLDRHTPGGA